ncbi:hypothetical protein QQ020_33220 [Fulvivirgaceae bacterium BMA12]|uniref:Uncharacterized protein n=1 Tax=Agaribacillus aureus TaxID=3051825 RepID=A0ABT8LGP8_9BACT|nr:hypothetical protein [Fulvivirgaceae bacterium BMA12]
MRNYSMTYPVRPVIRIYVVLMILYMMAQGANAQNYAGLQHKELKLVSNPELASAQLFPEVTGTIQRVFVRYESGSQLKLVLQYTGFENAYLTASTLDQHMKPQKQINVITGNLQGVESPVELVFNLRTSAGPGIRLRSGFVKISFSSQPDHIGPNSPQVIYKLNKAWSGRAGQLLANNQQGSSGRRIDNGRRPDNDQFPIDNDPIITNSHVVVKIDMEPIGSAARLNPNFVAKPPRPAKNVTANADSLMQVTDTLNTVIDTDPLGPSDFKLSLWENIKTDVEFDFADISNINLNIFRDKNPASNQFYYAPVAYNLVWNHAKGAAGYDLKTLFGTASDHGESGEVRIHARLNAGINTAEVKLIRSLLEAYVARYDSLEGPKLNILPVSGPPKVSFNDELKNLYNIPAEKVSVQASSDITKPINVSWSTDSKTKDEMVVALMENVGINGAMILQPVGDSVVSLRIPVHININDPQTFGKFVLEAGKWRKKLWVNTTPYPVALNELHLLTLEENDKGLLNPVIYSWDLGQQVVSAGGKAFFNANKVPKWLDASTSTVRIWLDYEVLPCDPCNKMAISTTLGGTSGEHARKISFELFDVLAQTGAKIAQIKVRSRQADPKGVQVIEMSSTLRIEKDEVFTVGPFFVAAGEKLDYEYHLTLIMPDGTVHEATDWVRGKESEVFLGVKNVQAIIPSILN